MWKINVAPIALGLTRRPQVYGTPKHVIDGELVPDTESAWGAADWADKLKSL